MRADKQSCLLKNPAITSAEKRVTGSPYLKF